MFQGNLTQLGGVVGLSRDVLGASWRVLEASWRCLGGVLGRLGGILDVSWGKCWKNVEGREFFGRVLRAKMEAKIIKIRIKNATWFYWRFSAYFLWFFMFLKVSWWRHVSFFRSYFASIFCWFFADFKSLETLKIVLPCRREHYFYKIDVFASSPKIDPKTIEIWVQKSMKIWTSPLPT